MVLPAEPIARGKELCYGLQMFFACRFLLEGIYGHSGQREEGVWGASVCVQALPQLSMLLRPAHGSWCALFGCPLVQLACLPVCTVTLSFSPELLMCPPRPSLHAPALTPVVCGQGAHSPRPCPTPLGAAVRISHPGSPHLCSAGDVGLGCEAASQREELWAGVHLKCSRDLFPAEPRGSALSSWGERPQNQHSDLRCWGCLCPGRAAGAP